MAECMYRFSVINGFKKKGSPFIVFNCADYAENPNLLIAHLFGVQKGPTQVLTLPRRVS